MAPHAQQQTRLLGLFPAITPYNSGFLPVQTPHKMYWEESGNPKGVPVVFIHGGPGGGSTPTHRRFFDPDHYRIIVYDQRGAGRSTPLGGVEKNSTELLVRDLEMLRIHLQIDQWHVFGGSWGSTLALHYAVKHPERCISMILRGIFLCEQYEIDWFLYGMKKFFPAAWEQFADHLPEEERGDLLEGYYKRLTSGDPKQELAAAIHWSLYEGACSSLIPNYETITTEEQKRHALALARLEAHYFKHHVTAPENSLLHHIDVIRHIPTKIIQGRYDVICPIETAHRLKQAWPEAHYTVVPDAGHSALDPALLSRLIEATEHYKKLKP